LHFWCGEQEYFFGAKLGVQYGNVVGDGLVGDDTNVCFEGFYGMFLWMIWAGKYSNAGGLFVVCIFAAFYSYPPKDSYGVVSLGG
jgi:hypothetical protein